MDSKASFTAAEEEFFRRGEELERAVPDDLSDLDDETERATRSATFRVVDGVRRRVALARSSLMTVLSRQ